MGNKDERLRPCPKERRLLFGSPSGNELFPAKSLLDQVRIQAQVGGQLVSRLPGNKPAHDDLRTNASLREHRPAKRHSRIDDDDDDARAIQYGLGSWRPREWEQAQHAWSSIDPAQMIPEYVAQRHLPSARDRDQPPELPDEDLNPVRFKLLIQQRPFDTQLNSDNIDGLANLGKRALVLAADRGKNMRLDEIVEREKR